MWNAFKRIFVIVKEWAFFGLSIASGGFAVLFQLVFLLQSKEVPPKWMIWFLEAVSLITAWIFAYKQRERRFDDERNKRPLLKIRDGNFKCDQFFLPSQGLTSEFDSLTVTVTNDPPMTGLASNASQVSAWVTVLNMEGMEKFSFQGRWSDSEQPPNLPKGMTVADLATVDIPVGISRRLDLMCRELPDTNWWAINNDSFFSYNLKRREFYLEPNQYTLRIRFRSPQIDQVFDLVVGRGENFKFAALTFSEVGPFQKESK